VSSRKPKQLSLLTAQNQYVFFVRLGWPRHNSRTKLARRSEASFVKATPPSGDDIVVRNWLFGEPPAVALREVRGVHFASKIAEGYDPVLAQIFGAIEGTIGHGDQRIGGGGKIGQPRRDPGGKR